MLYRNTVISKYIWRRINGTADKVVNHSKILNKGIIFDL